MGLFLMQFDLDSVQRIAMMLAILLAWWGSLGLALLRLRQSAKHGFGLVVWALVIVLVPVLGPLAYLLGTHRTAEMS